MTVTCFLPDAFLSVPLIAWHWFIQRINIAILVRNLAHIAEANITTGASDQG